MAWTNLAVATRLRVAQAGIALLVLAGCGESTPVPPSFGGEDGKAISVLVENFNEARYDRKRFKEFFVEVPKETKPYSILNYDLDGNPTIQGTEATAPIRCRKDNGADAGQVSWSFQKVGNQWKIKTAPLP